MTKIALFLGCVALLGTGCSHTKKTAKTEANKPLSKSETIGSKNLKSKTLKGEIAFGCKVGKDIRLVSVDKSPKRCEVYYQKFGDASQVAWAEATPSLCGEVTDRIKTNIETKGFQCSPEIAQKHLKNKDIAKVKFEEVQ